MSLRSKKVNTNSKLKLKSKLQCGGGASDFASSFYSGAYTQPSLNAVTLAGINNSPVFNPMSSSAVFATGTSGIIPNGMFYGFSPMSGGSRIRSNSKSQKGGAGNSKWINFVKSQSQSNGITFKEALSDPSIRAKYYKLKESGRL